MNTSKPRKTPLLAPTKPRVYQPRVPTPSTSTSSTSSLLGKLGSFNRKKQAKQSTSSNGSAPTGSQQRKVAPTRRFPLETTPDTSYPSTGWQTLKLRPAEEGDETEVIVGKRPREKGVEAPWTSYLKRAAKETNRVKSAKGKGKEKEALTRVKEEIVDDDDEVLVGEKSWETPSDRSTPPSLDEPGPSSLRQLSLDPIIPPQAPPPTIKTEPRDPYPIHPSRAFSPLFSNAPAPHPPPLSTTSSAHPPLPLPRPAIDPGYILPGGKISRNLTATWSVLHLGGFWASIPPHEIWRMVTPPHLPRPTAMRINRKPNVHYAPTFVAYSTREEAEEALKGLKFNYGEGNGKGWVSPSWSDKPASSITWSSKESVDAWEEMARMAIEMEEDPQIDPSIYVPPELIQGYLTLQIDDLPMSILRDEIFSCFPSDLVAGVSLPVVPTSALSNPTATKTGYLLFSSMEKRDAVLRRYRLEVGSLPGRARSIYHGEVEKPLPWEWNEMEQEWIRQHQGGNSHEGSNPRTNEESTRNPIPSTVRPPRRLPLPPPPPPPPPPAPSTPRLPRTPEVASKDSQPPRPSQALLEHLLSQLRRTDPNHAQVEEQTPVYPRVTYDADSDPRRKRRKLT
ncbi:hypothetical protein JCM5353_006276 [Sporobolomyces roseus]